MVKYEVQSFVCMAASQSAQLAMESMEAGRQEYLRPGAAGRHPQ